VKVLVDTNTMLRLVNAADSQNDIALLARDALIEGGHVLFTTPQNLIEFWAVCTRPAAANGLGLNLAIAKEFLEAAEESLTRLEDSDRVYTTWRPVGKSTMLISSRACSCTESLAF
jgi:predicted nucleic acid-binding protein